MGANHEFIFIAHLPYVRHCSRQWGIQVRKQSPALVGFYNRAVSEGTLKKEEAGSRKSLIQPGVGVRRWLL